jgi:hypothetical protein
MPLGPDVDRNAVQFLIDCFFKGIGRQAVRFSGVNDICREGFEDDKNTLPKPLTP